MGISGFLASQAEQDHYHFLECATLVCVQRSCDGELECEVHAILGLVGVEEFASCTIAQCLRDVKLHQSWMP